MSGLVEKKEEAFEFAMQLQLSSVLPMTLQAAFDLGVFEIIAKSGSKLSASQIASKLPTKNPNAPVMLDRILSFLACHSVISCSFDDGSERMYSLNSVSKFLVPNEDGVSLGPVMALNHDKLFLECWPQLKNAVLEGGVPFARAHETNAFEYLRLDSQFNHVFNKAMFNHTSFLTKEILKSYRGFENIKQLVDVGGGLRHTLRAITSKHSHINSINFDLPHVIEHAPACPGVEHVGGDMFERVPKGEAIFMKWILHDWNENLCLKLLKNCYNAIPEDGKVIVVEADASTMADDNVASKGTSLLDVLMMTLFGGKERTRDEFMALAIGAGFRGIRFECFACNFWIMEFFK